MRILATVLFLGGVMFLGSLVVERIYSGNIATGIGNIAMLIAAVAAVAGVVIWLLADRQQR